MSIPFQRFPHTTVGTMELLVVYLLLCLVIIVSFFVIPWVDWQRCESSGYCKRFCWYCCCGGCSATPATRLQQSGAYPPPLDTVIDVKPVAGKSDAQLSPTPSYSEFAPPDYDQVAAAMVAKTTTTKTPITKTTTMGNETGGGMQSRPSREQMSIFVVQMPKSDGCCSALDSNVVIML